MFLALLPFSIRPAPAWYTNCPPGELCYGPPTGAEGAVFSALATTGNLVSSVATTSLRPTSAPNPPQVRVLLISTGVAKTVFPTPLQSTSFLSGDLVDYSGWGTYAASVLLQLLPNVSITSKSVGTNGASAGMLEQALALAVDQPSAYDIVLLALNPAWLLDPVSTLAASTSKPSAPIR